MRDGEFGIISLQCWRVGALIRSARAVGAIAAVLVGVVTTSAIVDGDVVSIVDSERLAFIGKVCPFG